MSQTLLEAETSYSTPKGRPSTTPLRAGKTEAKVCYGVWVVFKVVSSGLWKVQKSKEPFCGGTTVIGHHSAQARSPERDPRLSGPGTSSPLPWELRTKAHPPFLQSFKAECVLTPNAVIFSAFSAHAPRENQKAFPVTPSMSPCNTLRASEISEAPAQA